MPNGYHVNQGQQLEVLIDKIFLQFDDPKRSYNMFYKVINVGSNHSSDILIWFLAFFRTNSNEDLTVLLGQGPPPITTSP